MGSEMTAYCRKIGKIMLENRHQQNGTKCTMFLCVCVCVCVCMCVCVCVCVWVCVWVLCGGVVLWGGGGGYFHPDRREAGLIAAALSESESLPWGQALI